MKHFCFCRLASAFILAFVLEAGAPNAFAGPQIASVQPPPGALNALTNIIVTFSEPVSGVSALDLFLGGSSAISVQGAGTAYTFVFDQPLPGPIELRWDADSIITDMASPPNRFDPVGAGTWQYEIVDHVAPTLSEVVPHSGLIVRSLTQIQVRFSEPVEGVNASDLLINGIAATNVTGQSDGPYQFTFPSATTGQVQITWAANHGIHDLAQPPNAFVPEEWSVEVNPAFVVSPVRINEFLSANVAAGGLKDEDGELEGWIEIYNPGPAAANLEGWSLTVDSKNPDGWVFPAVSMGPGQYLIVFASGKDRKPTAPGTKLHTNFKLNSAGKYLALFNQESPRVAVSEFSPAYPEQRNDYSYGYDSAGQFRYFSAPTPGAANGASALDGIVLPPHLNITRGWFDQPFNLIITSPLAGVTFRYTLDGSEPSQSNGKDYAGPLSINSTTTLRVAGFKAGMLSSVVSTHTYIFPDAVLRQSNAPAGFPVGPAAFDGYPSDYEMDPEVMTNPLYSGLMKQALLALPAMSIVCRMQDMLGAANGIYTHPLNHGPGWERPCSVEFIPSDNWPGFQANAGVQVQGNAARDPQKQPKHPLRLVFKGDYGPSHLNFPMFPDSPVSSFDTLVLRADFNYSWLHWDSHQRQRAQRTRDSWMKDSMRAMGDLASHNRYVHLFINGVYWGVYDPTEHPDAAFGASYLGGAKEDYDVMNEGAVKDGSMTAYNEMLAISNLADPAAYARMQQYLDLRQFIDYILLHFYVGHTDWGQDKNWYAIRPKDGHRGFYYVPWDGENILDDPAANRVTNTDTPSGLHTKLVLNAEYRLAFADRVQKHLFNSGALTPSIVADRWLKRAKQVDLAIIAESARWGDYRRDVAPYQNGPYELYTRNNQWLAEQSRLLTSYFPKRTATVLAQLRAAGLYPSVNAPVMSQFGGHVPSGFALSLSASDGPIYFTTDGSDPRVTGSGAIASTAIPYGTAINVTNGVRIKARVLRQGVWSALAEADFQVEGIGLPLRFTEIMYHPLGGDAFEFVELQNIGNTEIDLAGFSLTGVQLVFPYRTILGAGQTMVLASSLSPSSFAARYPGVAVSGYFDGSLANGGERVELRDRAGLFVTSVTYRDSGGWPSDADGKGFSLEVIDPRGDPDDPANWRASNSVNGSPGTSGAASPIQAVRLNEVFVPSPNVALSSATNMGWIELANSGSSPALIEGWTLNPPIGTPFVFSSGTVIPANGYLVVSYGGATNAAGLHAPFTIDANGGTIALYDRASRRIDAVTLGLQAPGFSVARLGQPAVWQLTQSTPGAANIAAETASVAGLKINEWLANPRPGEQGWIELYNPDATRPAPLKELALVTGDGAFPMQTLSFVPAAGFVRLFADESSGAGHLGFKLAGAGGSIALLDSSGNQLDQISYAAQAEDVSQGRLPDGASTLVSFPGAASPGQSNGGIGQQSIVLNEFLAGVGGVPGWIEIFNNGAAAVDLSNFQMDVEPKSGPPWQFPSGSRVGPSQYLVVAYDPARNPSLVAESQLQSGRSLASSGGTIYLRDPQGRTVDSVDYGFAVAGQSVGRTDGRWQLLSKPTPGQANAPAASLGQARSLRINEWVAATASGGKFFELYNSDSQPVALAGMSVSDDPSLGSKMKFQIGPLSFIAAGGWVFWKANNAPEKGPDHVNFSLDELGESLRLYASDGTLVDAVDFGLQQSGISEGRLTDGGPDIGPLTVGPTPGSSNTPKPVDLDSDGDGLPDAWEIAHGTNPALPDADADPDHDGLTNLQEFLAGTNPLDAESSLKFRRITLSASTLSLDFLAVSNRTYSVYYKQTLDATWSKLSDVSAAGTNRVETVTDPSAPTATRFYRLVTPSQP